MGFTIRGTQKGFREGTFEKAPRRQKHTFSRARPPGSVCPVLCAFPQGALEVTELR